MYFNAVGRNEPKNLVPKNRIATFGQFVFDSRQILIDDEFILFIRNSIGIENKIFGTCHARSAIRSRIPIFEFHVAVDHQLASIFSEAISA